MKMNEFIAWIRHTAWCGYQLAAGQNFNVEPTDEQWESLLKGVDYALDHPGLSPEQSHESWMMARLETGWTLGEEIDPIAKTHPNMVPFGQLPEIERRKDSMEVIAHNMGLKLWGLVQPDVQITKEDIFDAVGKIPMMNAAADGMARDLLTEPMMRTARDPLPEPRTVPGYLLCPKCEIPMTRDAQGFGFRCDRCGHRVSDSELARAPRKDARRRYPKRSPTRDIVDQREIAEPLKVKPLPGGVPGTRRVKEVSLGTKMRKYRCAILVQHRFSNAPGSSQVLISVSLLGRWEKPAEPAVVIEVRAFSEDQARDIALDLFRSLLSMKQVGEMEGGMH